MKKQILILILLISGLTVSAQRGPRIAPEQRAKNVSERMVKHLGISPAQKAKVYDLVLSTSQKARETKMKDSTDRKMMHENMKARRTEFEAGLKTILSPEQFTKWTQLKDQWREKRKTKKAEGPSKEELEEELGFN